MHALVALTGAPERSAAAGTGGLQVHDGRIIAATPRGDLLPAPVARAVRAVQEDLELPTPSWRRTRHGWPSSASTGRPSGPPSARGVARVGGDVYLLPDWVESATRLLATIDQPFTVSQARRALDTTRRVAIPLLERLDAERVTARGAGRPASRPSGGLTCVLAGTCGWTKAAPVGTIEATGYRNLRNRNLRQRKVSPVNDLTQTQLLTGSSRSPSASSTGTSGRPRSGSPTTTCRGARAATSTACSSGDAVDAGAVAASESPASALIVNLLTEDNLPSYHREIAEIFGRDGAWGDLGAPLDGRGGPPRHRDPRLPAGHPRGRPGRARAARGWTHMATGLRAATTTTWCTVAGVRLVPGARHPRLAPQHRHVSPATRCASQLMARIATDENLHMIFYRNLLGAALELDPDQTMRAITDVVKSFQMPGTDIDGSPASPSRSRSPASTTSATTTRSSPRSCGSGRSGTARSWTPRASRPARSLAASSPTSTSRPSASRRSARCTWRSRRLALSAPLP